MADSARFPILAFFKSSHLPEALAKVAKPFEMLALEMATRETAHPAELAAGLRKLLEAKDCAVRCMLPAVAPPKGA